MPPSEHVLIDKLAYRGARVHLSTPISREHQIWVVVEGPAMTNKQRKAVRDMVNIWFEDDAELAETKPQTETTESPDPPRPSPNEIER
jgi:hypothetical protein